MTTIVGIDCATDSAKVGVARATHRKGHTQLLDASAGEEDLVRRVADWIRTAEDEVLLALDAPLGWPKPLGAALVGHRAGQLLSGFADDLFRRATDQDVRRRFGKRPLDVGADRIARTARWALRFLNEVRDEAGQDIPLAWRWDTLERVSAIEVYPAATLVALNAPSKGYKGAADEDPRGQILGRLPPWARTGRYHRVLLENADALDAVVCVVAGVDFLNGKALPPVDQQLALQEGWIWVRERRSSSRAVGDGRARVSTSQR